MLCLRRNAIPYGEIVRHLLMAEAEFLLGGHQHGLHHLRTCCYVGGAELRCDHVAVGVLDGVAEVSIVVVDERIAIFALGPVYFFVATQVDVHFRTVRLRKRDETRECRTGFQRSKASRKQEDKNDENRYTFHCENVRLRSDNTNPI